MQRRGTVLTGQEGTLCSGERPLGEDKRGSLRCSANARHGCRPRLLRVVVEVFQENEIDRLLTADFDRATAESFRNECQLDTAWQLHDHADLSIVGRIDRAPDSRNCSGQNARCVFDISAW